MRGSKWKYSEQILHNRERSQQRLRDLLRLNYPERIRLTNEERRQFLTERPRQKYPDTRHLIKRRSKRWYGKRIDELVEQDDAMDMRIQTTILDITYETEKELNMCIKTDRLKDAFLQDMSWNIHTETEDVNLDIIHASIQGAIVDIILDDTREIKNRAVKAMHNEYPWYHSSPDDRSPLAAIFKHLGDDDSDDSD